MKRSPSQYYYHYTSSENLSEIKKDGFLMPQEPFYSGNIGWGIYVTTLDPFNHSESQLRQELFMGGNSFVTRSKLENFIALDKNDVTAACSMIQVYPGRPTCMRLLPTDDKLYLYKVKHYCGTR